MNVIYPLEVSTHSRSVMNVRQGAFPAVWKAAEVVPVPKKPHHVVFRQTYGLLRFYQLWPKYLKVLYANGFWTVYNRLLMPYSSVASGAALQLMP